MPFVRRRMRGPRSWTPASARSSSTHGPVAFTTARAPSVATRPVTRSRTRTPAGAPPGANGGGAGRGRGGRARGGRAGRGRGRGRGGAANQRGVRGPAGDQLRRGGRGAPGEAPLCAAPHQTAAERGAARGAGARHA